MSVTEVAKHTVSALKDQPLMLVVIVLNVLMLLMVGLSVREGQENHRAILELALSKCLPRGP